MDTVTNTNTNTNTTSSLYNSDEENKFKISKNSGHGTIHKIRDSLNFTDSKKWKKFSSRRLQLIDHFGLSERKASEQDDNIKQIADILRNEFEYPIDSLSDFEKLVTAAVQSVRRNRKRSKKKTLSRINTNNSETNNNTNTKVNGNSSYTLIVSKNNITEKSNNKKNSNKIASLLIGNPISSSSNLSSSSSSEDESIMESSNNLNLQTASTSSSLSSSIPHSNLKRSLINSNSNSNSNTFILPKQDSKRVKLSSPSISSTATPSINIHEPIKSMLRALIEIPLSLSKQYLINIDNDIKIPFHLKQNLLNNIQNSKSLSSTIDLYDIENCQQFTNLESLGQTSIRASLSLVVEKYFAMTLKGSLLDMLRVKSTSQDYIDKITQILFDDIVIGTLRQNGYPTILSNNTLQISSVNKIKTFNLIIGSIVKDYGFDSVLSPLNEIIQTLVNLEYQELQKTEQKTATSVVATVSPTPANNLNGLNMLSSVSLQVTDDKQQPVTSNILKSPSTLINEDNNIKKEKLPSVALFDDIIKRISNKNDGTNITSATVTTQPPNIAPSSRQFTFLPKSNDSLKSSFENGNLPQPIHQF